MTCALDAIEAYTGHRPGELPLSRYGVRGYALWRYLVGLGYRYVSHGVPTDFCLVDYGRHLSARVAGVTLSPSSRRIRGYYVT